MTAKVVLYYSDNCSYCNQFKPTWEALKSTFDKNNIKHEEYEAKNINHKEKNIKGYPTIRIETKDGEYEYDGPRNPEEIMFNVTSLMNGGAVLEGNLNVTEDDLQTEITENQDEENKEQENKEQVNDNQMGGGAYEEKYKKYKAKYLQLKSFMEKNGML